VRDKEECVVLGMYTGPRASTMLEGGWVHPDAWSAFQDLGTNNKRPRHLAFGFTTSMACFLLKGFIFKNDIHPNHTIHSR
jgi:hypothetical protein